MAVGNTAGKEVRIKNKMKRQQMFAKRKDELNKQRHKERRERAKLEAENPQLKEERLAENITQTIESKRVYDESVNVEIEGEDEFKGYFEDGKPPKVLITTNAKAHKEAYRFTEVFQELIPNSTFLKRKDQFNMKQMSKFCANRDFTDLIVVNEKTRRLSTASLLSTCLRAPHSTFQFHRLFTRIEFLAMAAPLRTYRSSFSTTSPHG